MTEPLGRLSAVLREAWAEALRKVDPRGLVAAALPPRPPKGARTRVLAAGKAAMAMAEGAALHWGTSIEDVLVIQVEHPDGPQRAPSDAPPIELLAAPHPIPDERSVRAAEAALARAASLRERDLCLALISGGASAVLCAPAEGLELVQKRAVTERLLSAGAPITEVNLVRRHLSRIKGGRLAAAAHPARVLTLVMSDVIGGSPADVGSGPTVPAEVDPAAASAVLERWAPELAKDIARHLHRDPLPPMRTRTKLVARPEDLAHAMAEQLRQRGLHPRVLDADTVPIDATLDRRLAVAERLAPGEAVVIACEPTVVLPTTRGRGGRAGRTALMAIGRLPPDVALLCVASDGADGSSNTSGALVTGAHARTPEVDQALRAFDDATAHAALGTALPGGPTGVNLADLHVVARVQAT